MNNNNLGNHIIKILEEILELRNEINTLKIEMRNKVNINQKYTFDLPNHNHGNLDNFNSGGGTFEVKINSQ